MKRLISLWFVLGWLALASCTTHPPQPTLAPTSAVAQLPDTPTPTPTATLTPIPSSPTATTTLEPTITSTPTPSPSPTPTVALPLPQGRLFFFWDPRSHTSAEEPDPNLYQVSFESQSSQWNVQTVLYYLNLGSGFALSPNKQWLAFLLQGDIAPSLIARETPSEEGSLMLYALNLQSFSYHSWTHENWEPFVFTWLPDNTTIAYRNSLGLLLEGYIEIIDPLWKPNAPEFAVGLRKEIEGVSRLSLISVPEGTTQVLYEVNEVMQMTPCTWSPDGEWLMFFMQRGDRTYAGIYLIHRSGQGLQPLVESDGRIMTPDGATSPPGGCFWLSQ